MKELKSADIRQFGGSPLLCKDYRTEQRISEYSTSPASPHSAGLRIPSIKKKPALGAPLSPTKIGEQRKSRRDVQKLIENATLVHADSASAPQNRK